MEQPQFILNENGARGSADVLHIQDRQHFSMDNATYTTCPAGNQDWYLNVDKLDIDRERQIGDGQGRIAGFQGCSDPVFAVDGFRAQQPEQVRFSLADIRWNFYGR